MCTSNNDIFQDMKERIACEYISDLPSHRYQIILEIKKLNLSKYDKKQLEDFSVYVFGFPYEVLKRIGVM